PGRGRLTRPPRPAARLSVVGSTAPRLRQPRGKAAADEGRMGEVESSRSRPRDVVLLGSTGSVGTQAADVIRRNPDRFRVTGLAAGGGNPDLLAAQAIEFGVAVVAVAQESAVGDLREALKAHPARAGSPRTGPPPAAVTGQRLAQQARPEPDPADGHWPPATSGDGLPATSVDERQATGVDERPATSVDERQATGGGGRPTAGEEGRAPLPTVLAGPDAIAEVAAWPADVVLNAVTGFSGLAATLAALRAGRILALANKES